MSHAGGSPGDARGRVGGGLRGMTCAPVSETHQAPGSSVSTTTCDGKGPLWWPALKTQVAPIRSAQAPPSSNGDWCTWPDSTRSG
jgi:hypothetical protein